MGYPGSYGQSESHQELDTSRHDWILLVDDDPQLRRSMREFLETSGFIVIEARNSYDGLFAVAQHGAHLRLMITELNLLPVGGVKLAENAIRLWPHLQILCMSAGVDSQGLGYWMRYLNAQFLQKPFSPFELHEKVHFTLGNHLQDAPISIMDYQSPINHSQNFGMAGFENMESTTTNNQGDPMFWQKEF